MKSIYLIMALALLLTYSSCSDDDDAVVEQTGEIVLKFDNGVADQDFVFGQSYSRSNGESFQLSNLKYIISNVRFKDVNGGIIELPEGDDVFIIDESDANNAGEIWLTLSGVPIQEYTEITFGVGIDQEQYAKGIDGQGDFWAYAQDEGMTWSWASGYKFVRFDGTFNSDTTTNGELNIHMGSVGSILDNYRETTLTFPMNLVVRSGKSPQVHVVGDIMKVFDGVNIAAFRDGYDQVHTAEDETAVISENVINAFSVHHIHND